MMNVGNHFVFLKDFSIGNMGRFQKKLLMEDQEEEVELFVHNQRLIELVMVVEKRRRRFVAKEGNGWK